MAYRPAVRLRPTDRLRRSVDFHRVMRGGRRVADSGLSLRWLERAVAGQRLGIIVPRDAGRAVLRNRVRRLIREFFRLGRGEFPDPADIVIVVRRGAKLGTRPSDAIRQAISRLASRARAAQGNSGAGH